MGIIGLDTVMDNERSRNVHTRVDVEQQKKGADITIPDHPTL